MWYYDTVDREKIFIDDKKCLLKHSSAVLWWALYLAMLRNETPITQSEQLLVVNTVIENGIAPIGPRT